jgi:hypothetical protein
MSERPPFRWAAIAIGTASAALAVILGFQLIGSEESLPREPTTTPTVTGPAPHATPAPPDPVPLLDRAPPGTEGRFPEELLYQESRQDGAALHRLDLRTGEDEVLFEARTGEFKLAPAGEHVAYVTAPVGPSPATANAPTPAAQTPILHIRDLESGEETTIEGVGSPEWSFDGQHLSVVRADVETLGLATISVEDMEVRALDLPEEFEWILVGWADDRLMLFRREGGRLFIASRGGALQAVPSADGELRSPSPLGTYAFTITPDHLAIFQPVNGEPGTIVDIDPWFNEIVNWTEDERMYAAVASGFKVNSPSAVLVLNPEGGSYRVPGTDGAVAALPTADGEGFLLVKGKHIEWTLASCLPTGECKRVPAVLPLGSPLLRLR